MIQQLSHLNAYFLRCVIFSLSKDRDNVQKSSNSCIRMGSNLLFIPLHVVCSIYFNYISQHLLK